MPWRRWSMLARCSFHSWSSTFSVTAFSTRRRSSSARGASTRSKFCSTPARMRLRSGSSCNSGSSRSQSRSGNSTLNSSRSIDSSAGMSHCSSSDCGGSAWSMALFTTVSRMVLMFCEMSSTSISALRSPYTTLRCSLATSSYSSNCLRMSKLRPSTLRCAFSMARVTHGCSMASPSSMPSFSISVETFSEPKMRIRLSSMER